MIRHTSPTQLFLALVALAQLTAGADPVKVSVFYETLCPDSSRFITKQLYPVYQDLSSIMTLDINAYGKSMDYLLGDTYVFVCQHGPGECQGNKMVTCGKEIIQNEDDFLAFTNCVMTEFTAAAAGPECAEKYGIDFHPIQECYTSRQGGVLLNKVGEKQREAAPNLNYVPWILINDVYTDDQQTEAEGNLRQVVCDKYNGEKPAACASSGPSQQYFQSHAARLGYSKLLLHQGKK